VPINAATNVLWKKTLLPVPLVISERIFQLLVGLYQTAPTAIILSTKQPLADIIFGSVLGSGSQGASKCRMAASYTGFPVRTMNKQSSDLSWDPAPKEQANAEWLLLILAFLPHLLKPDFYDIDIGDGLEYMTANPIAWNGSVNPRKINAINKQNRACNEVPPTVGTKSVARRIHMKRKRGKEVTAIEGYKIAQY
nr:3-ketoacyl-CoA thiolase 2, peroxisomal [Tanacetum cinerariifolium]